MNWLCGQLDVISKLPGLGPKSAKLLKDIGIENEGQLKKAGAIPVFYQLLLNGDVKPSLNFLYALEGAIQNRDWRKIAQQERVLLLAQLAAYEEMMERPGE